MPESLSRTSTPPGGWQFRQPQTGWDAPFPIAMTFDQQVQNIIKHRRENPVAVINNNLSLDPHAVANELEDYTRLRLGLGPRIAPPPPVAPGPTPQLPQSVRQDASMLLRTAKSFGELMEWVSSGKPPVSEQLADKRALTCLECPRNQPTDPAQWFLASMRRVLDKKVADNKLVLKTAKDAALNTCEVCRVPLALKVHEPLEVILAKTEADVLAAFPSNCWIAKRDQ